MSPPNASVLGLVYLMMNLKYITIWWNGKRQLTKSPPFQPPHENPQWSEIENLESSARRVNREARSRRPCILLWDLWKELRWAPASHSQCYASKLRKTFELQLFHLQSNLRQRSQLQDPHESPWRTGFHFQAGAIQSSAQPEHPDALSLRLLR